MSGVPGRVVVVPTYNRPDVLLRCLEAAVPQADMVIVVDNSDDPALYWAAPASPMAQRVRILRAPMRPPNLSKLWNIGLVQASYWAQATEHDVWDVAVLNDDAIIPSGWFEAVATAMRRSGAAAGSTGLGSGLTAIVHNEPGTTNLAYRLQGHAFVLRGEAGLRADERLAWWCGDNDLDMQARLKGGTLIMGGWPVVHLHPDESTRGELAAQTGIDMATFVDKWRFRPWAV